MGKVKVNRERWMKILYYVMAFILIIILGGYLLLPLGTAGFIIWIILTACALFFLVRWHASSLVYRCCDCSNTFIVPGFADLFIPYEITTDPRTLKEGKGLKRAWCPYCKKYTQSTIIGKN